MNEQAADPLHNEKESFESMARKLEHVHLASTIKLNVGGQSFFHHEPSNTDKKYRINATRHVFRQIRYKAR